MADLAPYPDVEVLLLEVLADLVDEPPVTSTPVDLQDRMPMIRVRRIGGSSGALSQAPRVAVEVYAGTRGEAWTVARAVEQRMLTRRIRTASGMVDRADVETGPTQLAYTAEHIRLVSATYRVVTRRWS